MEEVQKLLANSGEQSFFATRHSDRIMFMNMYNDIQLENGNTVRWRSGQVPWASRELGLALMIWLLQCFFFTVMTFI